LLSHRHRQEKQVRLTIFDNEPMARLAEQRLRQERVPCLVRSLQGGPGVWGTAYNLPHALYVYQSDQARAREILDLPPREIMEREKSGLPPGRRGSLWLIVIVVAVILGLIIAAPSFARWFG
jgi:hypothetical protein